MDRPLITATHSDSYKSLDQMSPAEQQAFADAMRPGAVIIPSGVDKHMQTAQPTYLDVPMMIDRGFETQRQMTMRDMLLQSGIPAPQQPAPAPLYGQSLPPATYDAPYQPPQYQPVQPMGQPTSQQPQYHFAQPGFGTPVQYAAAPSPQPQLQPQYPSIYQQAAQVATPTVPQLPGANPSPPISVLFELPNSEQFPASYLDVLTTEAGQLILVSSARPGAVAVYMPKNPLSETACRVHYSTRVMLYLLVPTGVIFEHQDYRYCVLNIQNAILMPDQ